MLRTWQRHEYLWETRTESREGLQTNVEIRSADGGCWILTGVSSSCQEDGAGIMHFNFCFGVIPGVNLLSHELTCAQNRLFSEVAAAAKRAAPGAYPKQQLLRCNDDWFGLDVGLKFYPKDSMLGDFTQITMGVLVSVLDALGIPRVDIGFGRANCTELVWHDDHWTEALVLAEMQCGILKNTLGHDFCDTVMFEMSTVI